MSVTGSTSPDTYNLTLQAAAAGYAPQTLPLTLTVLTPTLPSLQLLTINPTAVQAGGPATVTIQLSGPAPREGGAVINLSASGSALLPVLPTFTIAAGATLRELSNSGFLFNPSYDLDNDNGDLQWYG